MAAVEGALFTTQIGGSYCLLSVARKANSTGSRSAEFDRLAPVPVKSCVLQELMFVQVVPESASLVRSPEEAAILKSWDYIVNELLEADRQVGRQYDETVCSAGFEPSLEVIGDAVRRAHERPMADTKADTLCELSDGEAFPQRDLDEEGWSGNACIAR